jgi:TolB-like protein
MRRLYFIFFIILATAALAAPKLKIAFMGIEPSGVSESVASGVSVSFLNALINTHRFEVVERERLAALMEEQGLAISGCTTTECFVQVGKLAGAQKVVVGQVAQVGTSYIVSVRVVDVYSSRVEQSLAQESGSLEGLLTAANNLAVQLSGTIPVEGTVVSVSGNTIKTDIGSQEGVSVNDTVFLVRLGEEYYHPETGLFLGRDVEELGEAKITKVLADELSEALYSGDTPPITGDKVRLSGMLETDGHEVITTTDTTVQPRGKGPGFGVTLSTPFLFPVGVDMDWETHGLQSGGSLMLDIFVGPIFSLGPYFGLLTYTNKGDRSDSDEEDSFLEMLLGLGLKVRFTGSGVVRPWLFAVVGYASVSCDFNDVYESGSEFSNSLIIDYFGIAGGLGVDFWLSDHFSIGLGGLFHYNGLKGLVSDIGWTHAPIKPVHSVGGLLDIGIYF